MQGRLAITWGLSSLHGWGVFGLNLVKELTKGSANGWPRPLLLNETPLGAIDPALHAFLQPLIDERERTVQGSAHMAQVGLRDTVVLHSSGNGLVHNDISARFRGERNVGFTFFEQTDIPADAIDTVKTMNGMLTGSSWCRDILVDRGVDHVQCVHQGIDTELFSPRPASGRLKDRFVVFAGGKLEFRKGQDIALAAFRAFHRRHPDALLLTVWQNPWPESIKSLAESSHVSSLPADGLPDQVLPAWTAAEGIPAGAHIDAGTIANTALPDLLAEANAALFPNRCEGGTNLALMECMAMGLPCVVSMNTGHLDIADADNAFPLVKQSPVTDAANARQGWGESDVDEAVERLEEIYADRLEAKRRGGNARKRMTGMTWSRQVAKLVSALPD
jgi:glycosyltransferase involved in cell wall biosynthesis